MAIMQKRHYEFIARTIARIPDKEIRRTTLAIFCDELSKENFMFNEDKFRSYVEKHTLAD